jgi:uncharacterized protein RhaS with RHS repeats
LAGRKCDRGGASTQEDPIGVAGGINLYQFNGNNPASYVDPFGLCPQWLTGRPCSGGVDLAAGFVPGLSTGIDVATAVSGENPLTGEQVGLSGRAIALVGVLSPASGGQVRGLITGAKHALSEGLLRVTSGFSDKALRDTYSGAIDQINRHKEILAKASPEQVNSITKDIVKHEKRLQAAVEEMQRRGLEP